MIKWLKKLFIGLLIGLPILLLNFSSAYSNTFYPDIPWTISDWKWNIFTLRNNVNFTLNTTNWLISTYWGWTYPRLTNLFRTENWLYAVISCVGGYDCANINTSIKTQWYVKQAKICNYNVTTTCSSNDSNIQLDSFYNDSTYSSPDFMTLSDTQWNNSNIYYCFKYESINKQVCLIISDWFATTWSSLWITYNPLPSELWWSNDQISQYFTNSIFTPSTPSFIIPEHEREPWKYTNWEILEGYEAMGLNEWFCYWGFLIDDIFPNGWVPSSFTGFIWWSWANIIDIYNTYASAYGNDPQAFLRSFFSAYDSEYRSNFYGYPKALWWFFYQWDNVDLSVVWFNSFNSDFSILDTWEYCNLKRSNNLSDLYTWSSRRARQSYNRKDNVNNSWAFIFSWNNGYFSWSLTWFSTPKDFYTSLMAVFQWGLKDLENKAPLLPNYIMIFMFAIILVRMLSH